MRESRTIGPKPNIVFLFTDDQRFDTIHALGNRHIRTPHMDWLVRHGTTFTHACIPGGTSGAVCMPSRAMLNTGRGLFHIEGAGESIPATHVTLGQAFQAAGYETFGAGKWHNGVPAFARSFTCGGEIFFGGMADHWNVPVFNFDPSGRYDRQCLYVENPWLSNRATPRCFRQAIEFLGRNHQEDNWHLHLEVFDPHEPFDCPKKYRDRFHDTWRRGHFTWPEYAPLDPARDDAATVEHIRKCYAGTLFMADLWLGKFLDKMDRYRMWRDTTVILTTDHGHLLGEHGCWAKNYMMDYAELAHIPLVICDPWVKPGRRIEALTATMDLMPTLAELHGVKPPAHVHGRSLMPLLRRRATTRHDAVLYGYFGKDVNLTDGRYTYCRQPLPGSTVHHHTAMPRGFMDFIPRELLAGAELGAFLKHCHGVPHYRMTAPSHPHRNAPDFNPIYDLQKDPGQTQPIRNVALESRLAKKMKKLLKAADAPACQFKRLGL